MTDKVRASRDGHAFHEAWTARRALELLLTEKSDLIGIAIEGLSEEDQHCVSPEAVEIADLALYYGEDATFQSCNRLDILQFKYSVANEQTPFRASDAKKTIKKFSQADADFRRMHGHDAVSDKLGYEIITNRPIYPFLLIAVEALATGATPSSEEAQEQMQQIATASGLTGNDLASFFSRVRISGAAGSLATNLSQAARTVADWSATNDPMARARLGQLRQLVRDKAGMAGDGRNVIRLVDVLAALEIDSEEDLLPSPDSFPPVGPVVARNQLPQAVEKISTLTKPFLIHAAGGTGKTVFLQSLTQELQKAGVVVLFDCFGGGAYRAPEDARHLPQNGLIHLVNLLACRGLCDPILPGRIEPDKLIKTALRRFAQSVATIQRTNPSGQLFILIDAVDNAAMEADDQGQPSFPRMLLESLSMSGLPGVRLIASCRSERRSTAQGRARCDEFELKPFNDQEAKSFLSARMSECTEADVQVAQVRSGGNPRVLAYLLESPSGVHDPSHAGQIELDDLISDRIEQALDRALGQGYRQEAVNVFLTGLAVLPPPVPVSEYAASHAMEVSAVESFAADMAPLLDRTPHGLVFRDEPTETFVRDRYGADKGALEMLAKRLDARQSVSAYAARALPWLLQRIDASDQLFQLAFDDRLPESIKSDIGKRAIRYARLRSALFVAARMQDYDKLVRLMAELALAAGSESRGNEYLLDYPDLAVASRDVEASRRLFEMRAGWAGTHHARLAVANILGGDLGEGIRHARRAENWIEWFFEQDDPIRFQYHLDVNDFIAFPFYLAASGRFSEAARHISRRKEIGAFRICREVIRLYRQLEASDIADIIPPGAGLFVLAHCRSNNRGVLAATLQELARVSNRDQAALIRRLSRLCRMSPPVTRDYHNGEFAELQQAFLHTSAYALQSGLKAEASDILIGTGIKRPRLWSFRDAWTVDVVKWIIASCLAAVAGDRTVLLQDLLPEELFQLVEQEGEASTDAMAKIVQERLKRIEAADEKPDKRPGLMRGDIYYAEEAVKKIVSLLELCNIFCRFLSSAHAEREDAALLVLAALQASRDKRCNEPYSQAHKHLYDQVGREMALFVVTLPQQRSGRVARQLLQVMDAGLVFGSSELIPVVSAWARQPELHECAGILAARVSSLVGQEHDVSYRARTLADLGRALLPASQTEAAGYFQRGLKELDAIGSGNVGFTAELLSFAAGLSGAPFDPERAHVFTNICELNLTDEAEKFPWTQAGKAFARIAGPRVLAKLARWEDRGKIDLKWTLPPVLTALVHDGHLDATIALSLMRLVDPAETWTWRMSDLGRVVAASIPGSIDAPAIELLHQIERNDPIAPSVKTLSDMDEALVGRLGEHSPVIQRLRELKPVCERSRDEQNNRSNRSANSHSDMDAERIAKAETELTLRAQHGASRVDPVHLDSLEDSFGEENVRGVGRDFEIKFFDLVRKKISYGQRAEYLMAVTSLRSLDLFGKLQELKRCLDAWLSSAPALEGSRRELASALLSEHAEEILAKEWGGLTYEMREIAEFSGLPLPDLLLDALQFVSANDVEVNDALWLAFATILLERSNESAGRLALKRLLDSPAARLASGVEDGAWLCELDPGSNVEELAAGLIWFRLGAVDASDRWRAAHAVRCLAAFGHWSIIDRLVSRLIANDAGAFQAPELKFYSLHARLWLLVALARVAIDFPAQIWKYRTVLEAVVFDDTFPHVLMRHFAAETLKSCIGQLEGGDQEALSTRLQDINVSPYPQLHTGRTYRSGSHWGRPEGVDRPNPEFYFDYDFQKYDLEQLGSVFGLDGWEVGDRALKWIRTWSSDIRSMHDSGARLKGHQSGLRGMDERSHGYGHYLALHGLMLAAGELLSERQVLDDPYDDDPWREWVGRSLLTMTDGHWLADGTDAYPLSVRGHFLTCKGDEIGMPTDQEAYLSLAGINPDQTLRNGLCVGGSWDTVDDVHVRIASVLVSEAQADKKAQALSKKAEGDIWLPELEAHGINGTEYCHDNIRDVESWIVSPSVEPRLDGQDHWGSRSAAERRRPGQMIRDEYGLVPGGPFNREWRLPDGRVVFHSEAWGGRHGSGQRETVDQGNHLMCDTQFLGRLLERKKAKLMLLIKLCRTEKNYENGREKYTFSYATCVLTVSKELHVKLFGVRQHKQRGSF